MDFFVLFVSFVVLLPQNGRLRCEQQSARSREVLTSRVEYVSGKRKPHDLKRPRERGEQEFLLRMESGILKPRAFASSGKIS
jgi:hypothetical protein